LRNTRKLPNFGSNQIQREAQLEDAGPFPLQCCSAAGCSGDEERESDQPSRS
jgi:hypothetical protein